MVRTTLFLLRFVFDSSTVRSTDRLKGNALMAAFPPDGPTLHVWYRGLLIADIVLFLIQIPVRAFSEVMAAAVLERFGLSPELSPAQAVLAGGTLVVALMAIPALIASWVGLFSYKSWSRWLYAVTTLAVLVLFLPLSLLDVSLQWGFPVAVDHIDSVVTGALLAVLFLSPVAREFAPGPEPPAAHDEDDIEFAEYRSDAG